MNAPSALPLQFRTITGAVSHEIEVERSRFLCTLAPVTTEQDARAVIEAARRAHPKARHRCSAFVLGPSSMLRRTNDDSEPSGTAGVPMLEALTGAQLTDVVAVVVRYFGGTLLGAGRLARTYRSSVVAGIAEATLSIRTLHLVAEFDCDYQLLGRIKSAAADRGWKFLEESYSDTVALRVAVQPSAWDDFASWIASASAGALSPVARTTSYLETGRIRG